MRQLKPNTYEELKEAVTRYISTWKPEREPTLFTRPDQQGGRRSPTRESKGRPSFGQRRHTQEHKEGYKNNNNGYDVKYRDVKYAHECYGCGKRGHYQRDCRVKLEEAKCGLLVPHNRRLPEWTKTVWINGQEIKALLDTGCTKTLVRPRCVTKEDYLGWDIPYHTASSKWIYFPAASVELEIEGRVTKIPVGVPEHIGQDILMGRDIPHFRNFLKIELEEETREEGEEPTPPASAEIEAGMVVTRARQRQQDALEEEECLRQEQDGPVINMLDSVDSGVQAEGLRIARPSRAKLRRLERTRWRSSALRGS